MGRQDIQDLLDRRDVLLETLASGDPMWDPASLDAELNEVRAALGTIQPISRGEGYPTRDASPLH